MIDFQNGGLEHQVYELFLKCMIHPAQMSFHIL